MELLDGRVLIVLLGASLRRAGYQSGQSTMNGALLAGVVHEITTPLTVAPRQARLLRQWPCGPLAKPFTWAQSDAC